jgi:HlyD family secretion protein
VGRRANVVVVPADAVHDAAGGQPWVMIVAGRSTLRRPVKLGLKGEGSVEVVEGVEPGDVLVSVSAVAVNPGQRVRAIPAPQRAAS